MFRTFATALVLTSLASLAVAGEPAEQAEAMHQTVLRLTNEFRKSEGRAPLKENKLLDQAAQKHAENMARQEKCEHVLDGKNPKDRVEATGYRIASVGENVHANQGFRDPAPVAVEWWKKSPGHRKNMLAKKYTEIGVGVARSKSGRWYFCQVFGRPR